MPCKPLEKIEKYEVPLEMELWFQYEKLLLMNNGQKNDFIKGFKYCMEFIIENTKENANT